MKKIVDFLLNRKLSKLLQHLFLATNVLLVSFSGINFSIFVLIVQDSNFKLLNKENLQQCAKKHSNWVVKGVKN